jgi:hypothetical protein
MILGFCVPGQKNFVSRIKSFSIEGPIRVDQAVEFVAVKKNPGHNSCDRPVAPWTKILRFAMNLECLRLFEGGRSSRQDGVKASLDKFWQWHC